MIMIRFLEFLERVDEGMLRKRMVRDGKVVQKWKTTRPGTHRIEYDENHNPHEVRMTPEEIKKREMGQKTGENKREAVRGTIEKKRKLSFNVRRRSGLKKYDKKFPDVNSEHDESAE